MVSVIVPVYNVEKYVRQCLDSLKDQTLEDVEFIVIDDGSTDLSGSICDEYKDDSRFRVFHTENRGLSAARNRGIDESRGEWIEFVDSDDWVEPGFCEIPLRAAVENNADLVIFQRVKTSKNGRIKTGKKRNTPTGIIRREQIIDYGGSVVWNKLYRKALFAGIRFPEGHVYEDVATTHKTVYKADRILMIQDILYYYRERKGSITQTNSIAYERDRLPSQIQRYQDLVRFGYSEEREKERIQLAALKYCIHIEPSNDVLYQMAEEILSEAEKIPTSWQWKRKIMYGLWKIDKRLFHFFCRLSGKKIKG